MDMDRELKLLRDLQDIVTERDRLRAALKEIQKLSLKTENANLVWQVATHALEQKGNGA